MMNVCIYEQLTPRSHSLSRVGILRRITIDLMVSGPTQPIIAHVTLPGYYSSRAVGVCHEVWPSEPRGRYQANIDMLSAIASISKVFTAEALLLLISTGKLTLTTYIKDIFPQWKSQSRQMAEELTIMDLLTYRTGLEKSNN